MLDNNTMSGDVSASADPEQLSALRARHYPGLRFSKAANVQAGRLLKHEGKDAAVAFLAGKGQIDLYDARPPAKCGILARSRPISEWPIAIVARQIQQATFALRLDEYDLLKSFKPTTEGRHLFLHRLGVDSQGLHAQALNLIIPHALNIYGGVLLKVENYNEKKLKKAQKANERRREQGFDVEDLPKAKVATNAEGYLQEPPGVNPSIYCYQQVSPKVVTDTTCINGVPECFANYQFDPDAPLSEARPPLARRAIPPGQYGHIPEFQHHLLNMKKKRRRAWYSNANNKPKPNRRPPLAARAEARIQARAQGALLVLIVIGSDWVLIDARGLLRSAVYRGLYTPTLSLRGLLDMFTGDPVIDPDRDVVTFLYKEGIVPVRKLRVTSMKKAPELIAKLTATHDMIGIVSVDLGQTNPLAARVSRLKSGGKPELVSQLALPEELLREWTRYRSDCDRLEERLETEAVEASPPEARAEIERVKSYCPLQARRLLAERFQVDPSDLPWEQMSGATYFIADRVLREHPNDADQMHFVNPKKGTLKRTDHNIYKWTRPKMKSETRESLNDRVWDLKRSSPEYGKLSQRKRELSRRCINWLSREARRLTHCKTVVVICEDLNVRMFHGKGKRDLGWDQFFVRKRENRWLIQALHRALTEIAPHQGIPVIEVNPARTSITCPRCDLCNKASRNGEEFCCVGCGVKLHADFEVATANVERVALTGQSLPKPKRESLNGGKAPRGARGGGQRRKPKLNSKATPSAQRDKSSPLVSEENLSQSGV